MQSCEMFLELEGRIELHTGTRQLAGTQRLSESKDTDLMQRHEGRSSRHIGGLGSRMDAPFGIRVDGGLLDLRNLSGSIRGHQGRFGTDLNLGWRGRAR